MKQKIKLTIIIVISLIILIAVPTGIYCAVNHETPKEMVSTMFQGTDKKIIGKWQSDNGIDAYEFFEDGVYDRHTANMTYSGKYSVKGNTVTVTKIGSGMSLTYKVDFSKDTMTLELIKEGDLDPTDEDKMTYRSVQNFDLKTAQELIDYLLNSVKEE